MIKEFISELNNIGIKLTYEQDKLKYIGPEESISSEIIRKLKENKDEIIRYLISDAKENSPDINDFTNLITLLVNKDYNFYIKDTKLKFVPPPGHNKNIENAILKNYDKLFNYFWPLPEKNLVPIQPKGHIDPFFIVHGEQACPIMKDIFGDEIPIFDFFHQSEDGTRMKYRGVKKIAKYYLEQLLSIKDDGNFILGGYSFGGILAYEMALQLKKIGKNVKFLILIDTTTPKFKGWNKKPKFHFYSVTKRFEYYIKNPYKNWYKKNITCKRYFSKKEPLPIDLRQFYIIDNYMIDSKKYKPGKFDGKLYLITAGDQIQYQQNDPYLGWKDYINGDIKIISTQGNHFDIIKNPERAKVLSEKIKRIIKDECNSQGT